MYQVTKPTKNDPTTLRVVKSFDNLDDAIAWAATYIFKNDKRFFIDDQKGHRYATISYDESGPVIDSQV
jgi:uncharacterized membrane protein